MHGSLSRRLPVPAIARGLPGRRTYPVVRRFFGLIVLAAWLPFSGCRPERDSRNPAHSEVRNQSADASSNGGTANPRPACATILSTNDTHGKLQPDTYDWTDGREVGGAATLAAHFDSVRVAWPDCPVFVLSAGDMLQGTPISNLTDGRSTIEAANAIGYDALAIGNHEFDWGMDVLRARIEQAEFPFLGANIFQAGTDRHPEWSLPYVVIERAGVRLGVVGVTTRSTPSTTKPANVSHLEFRPIAEALDRYVPEVQRQGVDFVVVVMHAGAYCDDQGTCAGEAMSELAATRASFDYVVTGHTHSRVDAIVRGAPVVQSFSGGSAYGHGLLRRGPDGSVRRELIEVRAAFADEVTPDRTIAAVIERYRAEMAREVERVVATLAEPLPKRGAEYGLGRLIADAQRAATGAEVAIMNNGGIRRPLDAGPVTYQNLFELHPFQNTLVRLQLDGASLLAALEHALARDGRPDAHVSGLVVRYDPAAPAGSRVVAATLADGRQVQPDSVYTVTVNDFMVAGGSGYVMFMGAETAVMTGILDLEALVEFLTDQPPPVEAPPDPRWRVVGG